MPVQSLTRQVERAAQQLLVSGVIGHKSKMQLRTYCGVTGIKDTLLPPRRIVTIGIVLRFSHCRAVTAFGTAS